MLPSVHIGSVGIGLCRVFRSALSVALSVVIMCFAVHHAIAVDESGPFVAGFDRFARHGDIEPLAAGRLLIAELSCSSCHATTGQNGTLLSKGGPRLDGAALRLQPEWLEAYIAAPHAVKPESTMPDVLGARSEQERKAIAKSLTAFLSTQQKPPAEVKGSGLVPVPHEFWNKGDSARGKVLYHAVGCVACHQSDQEQAVAPKPSAIDQLIQDLDADELAELGLAAAAREVRSVPFSELKAKYTASGLTHFLLDPHQSRPASRMPSLKLAPIEAADLASYLLKAPIPSLHAWVADPAEIEKGKRLFMELNCVQCHTASDLKPRRVAKPLTKLNLDSRQHCLGNEAATSVRYRLDAAQVDALRMALEAEKIVVPPSPNQQLEQYLLAYNCYACHERNARGGVARFRRDHFETVAKVDLGDEGRLPPPLTGVGRKLQTAWLKNVLLGKKADMRPHMQIRMPLFHNELANRLPELFRIADEADAPIENVVSDRTQEVLEPKSTKANSTERKIPETEQIEAGRQLMDVGCVQCHAFDGHTLPGIIGVDVRGISTRVRPEWFREFVLNPGAVKARTRMPSFFPDGKSQRPDVLAGDIDRQIAAMWAYLSSKSDVELPTKIKEARAQNYELRPTERPIVLRTFMNEAGTHAIAVGFPQQIHYAFNSENMQLAVGWRGKFLDAQGTWFIRFAPSATPLGETVVEFPNAVPLAQLSTPADAWPVTSMNAASPQPTFSGYRLDSGGVPTLLYQFGTIDVEDRIEPIAAEETQLLRRTLTLKAKPPTSVTTKANAVAEQSEITRVWLLAATGKKLTRITEQSFANETGLRTTLKHLVGQVRTSAGREEWLLPIELEKSFTVELHYQW